MIYYVLCGRCGSIFITTLNINQTLICGSGCGGKLKRVSKDEAESRIDIK